MKKLMPLFLLLLFIMGVKTGQSQDTVYRHYPTKVESFEIWKDGMPENWGIINNKTDKQLTWAEVKNGAWTYSRSGSKAVTIKSSSTEVLDDWLISPKYEIDPANDGLELSFWYGGFLGDDDAAQLVVCVSETGREANAFTVLETISVENSLLNRKILYTQKTLDLSSFKGKSVYIGFHALSKPGAPTIYIDDVQLYSAKCISPSVQFKDVRSFNATAYWDKGVAGTTYELVYSRTKLTNPATQGTRISGITDSFCPIKGLSSGTFYYFYIHSVLSSFVQGEWSGPFRLETTCASKEIPESDTVFYTADFESPACWSIIDEEDSQNTWIYFDKMVKYNPSSSTNKGADDWLLSPVMKILEAHKLVFTYTAVQTLGYNPDVFSVWFVQDTSNLKGTGSQVLLSSKEYYLTRGQKLEVDLSHLAGQYGRIAFRVETPGPFADLSIHSFSIEKHKGCPKVNDLKATEITETTATMEWKSLTEKYEIRHTNQAHINPDQLPVSQPITENEVTFTGLTGGVNYYAYIRTICNEEFGEWEQLIFRTTLIVRSFPFYDDFDKWQINLGHRADTTMDWTIVDGNGDQFERFKGIVERDKTKIYAGISGTTPVKTTPRDQWMISPKMVLPAGKRMFASFIMNSSVSYSQKISVLISTKNNDTSSFIPIIEEIPFSTDVFRPVTIDLSAYAEQEIYIAIQAKPNTVAPLLVDNFSVEEMPTKYVAPKNIKITPSQSKIEVSWDAVPAVSYRLAYQNYFFNPNVARESFYITTTSTSVDITHLLLGSPYFICVQAVYADGYSEWIGPLIHRTGCDDLRMPLIETLDNWSNSNSVPNPLGCWKYINTQLPDTGKPIVGNVTIAGTTANYEYSYYPEGKGFAPSQGGIGDTFSRILSTPLVRFPYNGVVVSYKAKSLEKEEKVYYSIVVSAVGNSPDDFLKNGDILYTDSLTGEKWFPRVVNLQSKIGDLYPGKQVYLAFVIDGKSSKTDIYGSNFRIDDIVFDSIIPGCEYPKNIQGVGVNNSSDVSVSWTSNASSFEIKYSDIAFSPYVDPERGTYIQNIPNDGSTTSYTLTGFIPGKRYYVWVRGIHTTGESTLWIGPEWIYGGCGVIDVDSYYDDFDLWENEKSPDSRLCWKTYGSTSKLGFIGKAEIGESGSIAAHCSPYNTTSGTFLLGGSQLDEWLISPKFKIQDPMNLSFKYKTKKELDEVFYVLISSETSEKNDFKDTLAKVIYYSESFSSFYADLTPYIGKEIHIAIVYRTHNHTSAYKNHELTIDDFRIEKNLCVIPLQLEQGVVNAITNTVPVSWEGTSESGWILQSKLTSFIPGTKNNGATEYAIGNMNSYDLPIIKGSQRVVYLRSNCANSMWVGPLVIGSCEELVSTYPYAEGFEDWQITPRYTGCWDVLDGNHEAIAFSSDEGMNLSAKRSGLRGGIIYRSEDLDSIEFNKWMIRGFDLSSLTYPIFEMWGHTISNSSTYIYEKLSIYISHSNDTAILGKEENKVGTMRTESDHWSRFQVDLKKAINSAGLDKSSPVYIGIKLTSPKGKAVYLGIDDIKVFDAGVYEPITDLKLIEVTTDKASISWKETYGNKDNYQVLYKKGMFDPYAKSHGASKVRSEQDLETFVAILPNLAPGSEYYYYIAVLNGTDTVMYGPYELKTDSPVVTSYPYNNTANWLWGSSTYRDFGDWNVIDENKDNKSFRKMGKAFFYQESSGVEADTINDWVIGRGIVLPSSSEIKFSYNTGAALLEKFDILIGKKSSVRKADGSYDLSRFEKLHTIENSGSENEWVIIDQTTSTLLANYVGDTILIAFHMYSSPSRDGNYNQLYIDSFSITSLYPCNLVASGLQATPAINSAVITWTPAYEQSTFNLRYWKNGTTVIDTIPHIESTTYTLSDLYSASQYSFQVQAVCEDKVGPWSSAKGFTTDVGCPVGSMTFGKGENQLLVSWSGMGIEYELKWKKSGELWQTRILTNREYLITDLEPETAYEASLRIICSIGDTSGTVTSPFRTNRPCPSPDNGGTLSQTSKEKYSATLGWTDMRVDGGYFLQYRLHGSTTWISGAHKTKLLSVKLENLLPGKLYEWRMWNECEDRYYSDTTQLHTFETQELDKYPVHVEYESLHGTITGSGESYEEQSEVILKAVPAEGYKFLHWMTLEGDILCKENEYTFTIDCAKNIRAYFVEICAIPSGMNVILPLEGVSALLRWEGLAPAHVVSYKAVTMAEAYWINQLVEGVSELELTSLQRNTDYDWKIRSACALDSSDYQNGGTFRITSVKNMDDSSIDFRIIPNPVKQNQSISVKAEGVQGKVNWFITEVSGKVVKTGMEMMPSDIQIEVKGLVKGIYFLKLQGVSWEKTKKIVIQ